MTLQKIERFHEMYHGDLCDVQIGDVDTKKDVGRVGRSYASTLIMPPQMNCIYSCICNDSRGDQGGDNSCRGEEHLPILRIGREVKNNLMRNNYAMKSGEFGKVDNGRCKKVISEEGFRSIDEDSSERVRLCDECFHACTIAEYGAPSKTNYPEEYLHGGRLTREGMKGPTDGSNSLTHQQRKDSSCSSPGGSAILKKETSKENITPLIGEASKVATLLHKKNVHRGNNKNLNNGNMVVSSTGEEKNENVIELSKEKPLNSLKGAIRNSTCGKENAPKMKPLLTCRSGRKFFRSHLKLHRLKCRTMKIIEKLKDAMIKENIAYNRRGMTRNRGHDDGNSPYMNGKEVDPDEKSNNDRSHKNGERVGRSILAKRTKGTFLKEEDYLVYKFRRTLRRYVKKYLHKKIKILENSLQGKRNIANEEKVHTFIIPSMSERAQKDVSNYYSYVDKYVRKFFHSYFVKLVNQFFNYYFFHYKRKCVKNYVGRFGARGGKLEGETASHHQPFCHSRFSIKNDNVACSKVMYSSCHDTSEANSVSFSGKEDTLEDVKNITEGSNPSGRVFNNLHVESFQKGKNILVSANPKRRNSPCVEFKLGAVSNPWGSGSRGRERIEGRVCSSNDASGNSNHTESGSCNGSSGGSGSGNGSGNSNGDNRSGSTGGTSGSNENDGNGEDNNEDHNDHNNDDSGNESSNESSNDNIKGKDTKGNNGAEDAQLDEPKEKICMSTNDNEHENYYKLIREIEFLENNENAKEGISVKKKDSIDTVPGGDEQKVTSVGGDNGQVKLDSGTMEKEEDGNMKLDRSGEDNQLLNINQMIIHTTNYVSQPLKLPLLPEMSHPNSYSSLSPRNNTCGSSSSSSSSGSSGSSSSSGNSSSSNSSSNNNQGGGKNNINQLNDPDFEEACDIRLMNTPENMKFSQSPPTSSLHASSLHLTDVNELVLSPNQQICSNSPLKSPSSTPLTPASPIFDSNYNEENMEKVNSNYFVSSPYRNDIFSEFDMLGSFFESLDELENKSDYTESSSNENSKFSQDFSLDMCGPKKGKKGNIQRDEVIYNFKRDNYKKVFHAWCNKGKHELNYDNKKFNSIMEWINYIEELMSHEGQNDSKGDGEEERQEQRQQQQQEQQQMEAELEEEQCNLLHEMEHELEHEREQEDIMNIGMNGNFFNEENVYQVDNSAFHSDEYIPVGKENEGGNDQVDYSVNSGVDYLVSTGVDYMVSSMADYAVSGNDQGEYYKDSGESGVLKEENKCDNFLASQNVNVMMSTPEQGNNSFVADNLSAYQGDEAGGGAMGSPHSQCGLLSSSLVKPNYDANPCISTFGGEQNLLSEYNNAEDNVTYCNNDTRQEALGDYFHPSTLDGAQIQSGSSSVGGSGFMWNNGTSGAEGNSAGNISENVANAMDNHEGDHHVHVLQPVGTENTPLDAAEKVGAQNEKDTAENYTPSSNCADVPNPWMAQ
ncbi:Uncharacterized protein PCOAH_00041400 [Plasmodium coatneyi]|uniref:Uncharacterized protein n=1 Tax=Plasmodium coatneyi TaxID=208452 RepID=A0A1B1E585_9APIC|nr:Uncharacterized protein PCOAH_00041400 [Plasmodium coatneyi]ANQ10155.1 Uncharacterized protein PCOAH_00041400 [Plasmodium coatneyi]